MASLYSFLWSGRSKKCRYITYFLLADVFIVINVIIWGLVVGLRRTSPQVSVIVPLYIYPSEGAWDPLYAALDKYPSLQFLVVVNPDNGPGNNTILDINYQQQLATLHSKKNAMTLGYIPINYTFRNLSDVFNDINTYASWSGDGNSDFTLHGIFFDKTPSAYSDASSDFMNRTDSFVKAQTGFGGVNFIVHNPGTVPNDRRFLFGADLIILFDGEYSDYISGPQAQQRQLFLAQLPSQNINNYQRQNFSYIFNGVPSNWSSTDLQNFVNSVYGGAQWLFATDINLNNNRSNYQEWGSDWDTFVQVMASVSTSM